MLSQDKDTLSEVLRAIRLRGAVFFKIEASAPWVTDTPAARTLAPFILPSSDHVIEYHMVRSGTCWGGIAGEPPVRLETGDVIVFPQGDPHVISSQPGMRGRPELELERFAQLGRLPVSVSLEGGGEAAQLVCGFFGCDARPFNPLLTALPRVIHLRAGAGPDNALLRHLLELAARETSVPQAGSDCMLSRLSELLFVAVVRRYLASSPPEQLGWFAGLADEQIGRALNSLHQRPSHGWGLDELAREAGVSRSVLAERFTRLVGVPPMQYLAEWRLQLAATALKEGSHGLAQIAEQVGYGSEAALSRAFKRQLGVAPAAYRRGARASAAPSDARS